jgi:hypothetical protein
VKSWGGKMASGTPSVACPESGKVGLHHCG